jgi:DNA-directed RNA polymerase subunit M/transcription elongation factor TFIIS
MRKEGGVMAEKEQKEKCFMCGASEEQAVLLQARKEGSLFWVCVRCLPILIHG